MKKSITTRLMLTFVLTLIAWTTAGAYNLVTTTLEHGSVAFKVGGSTVTSAAAGAPVTIVLTPEEGYAATTPTAKGYMSTGSMKAPRRAPGLKEGVDVALTSTGNPNVYTFTMPENDVELSVSFVGAYKLTKSATSEDHGIVALKVDNNTVSAAGEGVTVHIYVDPLEKGYAVKAVTATTYMTTSGMKAPRRAPKLVGDLALTQVSDTHYTFTMPASDVEVDVTYEYIVKTIEASWIQDIADQTYNGSELTPAVTVMDGVKKLTLGTDYTVSYIDNTNAANSTDNSAPTVFVYGIGNYDGIVSKTFTINPAMMEITAVDFSGTYDGQGHTINVTVPEGASISYKTSSTGDYVNDNPTYTDVGTYTVYFKVSKTNYEDVEGICDVIITPRWLTAATLQMPTQLHTGDELTFDVDKVTAGTITLSPNDYEVTGNKATAVGNYTATVNAKDDGNFLGSVSVPYSIVNAADKLFKVEVNANYEYDGHAHEPIVVVRKLSTNEIVDPPASKFTVTYSNNTNAGTATVTVTPNDDDYYGTQTATFNITKKALTVKAVDQEVYYGDPAPTYEATYTGLVEGDNLDGTLAYNCSYVPNVSGLNSYPIYPVGLTSNNYNITFEPGTLTVKKVNATVVAPPTPNTNLTYNGGNQLLVNAGTATGGKMMYKVGDSGAWSEDIANAKNAGTYDIYYKVAGDANHNDVAEAGPIKVTIAKAQLIVKADDKTVSAGETPTFTVTYKGFQNNDNASVLVGTPFYTCLYPTTVNDAGTYDIMPFGLALGNYDIHYVSGTLTVEPGVLVNPTITLSSESLEYTGNACEPEVTVKDGETVIPATEYTVSYTNNINVAASTEENAPTVTITDKPGGSYTFSGGTKTFTITQAANAFLTGPTIENWAVGGTPNEPTATVKFGTIVYKYGSSASGPWETAENTTFTEGTWYVKGFVEATTNYTAAESAPVAFEITEPVMVLVTPPTAVSTVLAYSNEAQELFEEGSATGGTLKYKVTTTNSKPTTTTDFTTTIDKGTNAGTYYLWYFIDGGAAGKTDVNDNAVMKTIEKRDISLSNYDDGKSVIINTTDQTWTGGIINVSSVYTIVLDTNPTSAPYSLTADDYTVTVEKNMIATDIRNEGQYTLTFVGKGNFTGSVTKTFNVMKDVAGSLDFDIPVQVKPQTGAVTLDFTVYDANTHEELEKDVDYSVKFFESDSGNSYNKSATEITDVSTLAQGKYWLTITGLPPKYGGSVDKPFYVVNEYQSQAATATNPAIAFRVDQANPGNIDDATPGDVRVGAATGAAVDAASKTVVIPASISVTVADKSITFNVTGIENDAFDGCSQLRFIDGTAIDGGVNTFNVDRQGYSAPFKGLPLQTLVFLNGKSYSGGENYIYKVGVDQYQCETLKIYDDINSDQKGFTDATAAEWGFMNPYEFKADKVVNTRVLKAKNNAKQQGYTTCLPYALPITGAFKVYALKASKDDQVGFDEVTGTLDAMTPYVLIPSTAGELLSTTKATVVKTYDVTTAAYTAPATLEKTSVAVAGQGQYTLKGTVQYLSGAPSMYIMQSNNVWNEISAASEWPGPCVLPMRSYIVASGAPARLFSTFIGNVENIEIDADDKADIYDLQGRKVKNPQRGSIYIVNGKKISMK